MVGWCIEAFAAAASVERALLAAPPGLEAEFEGLGREGLEIEVISGGRSRAESVAGGLERIDPAGEFVAVHDAARPFVSAELIDALIASLAGHREAAGVIAATPVTDTIKHAGEDRVIRATEPRAGLWVAQTPQVFRVAALREAHRAAAGEPAAATDDAMLVERNGGTVLIEAAPAANFKVTTVDDLRVAELLLNDSG